MTKNNADENWSLGRWVSPRIRGTVGPLLVVTWASYSCTQDTGSLDADPTEAGAPEAGAEDADRADVFDGGPDVGPPPDFACTSQGHTIPGGLHFADGCNDCVCVFSPLCAPNDCRGACTGRPCDGGVHGSGTCTSSTTCEGGPCLFFPGCEAISGRCANPATTPCRPGQRRPYDPDAGVTPAQLFCGCDGVTYEGNCPVVPYAHAGPCP